MWKVIWIDLWTTNSCVAFMEWGQPKVITNAEWWRTTPSIVAYSAKNNEVIVWTRAKRQAVQNAAQTIFSAKRFIWRKFDEVQNEIKNVPFKVVKWKDWECLIEFNWKDVRPEEISAKVLEKIKEDAERFIWEKVTEAVITVPAYFNDDQRQATINAGKIAWLEVKRIVNEPTAAALSYGLDKKKDEKVAVYDFGWGTFDISILEISSEWTFEVLATNWDTHLGWDDFDQRIFEYVMAEFQKNEWIDLRKDPMAVQRVRTAAEKAKIELSSATETEINEPFIALNNWVPSNLNITISRAKFEELIYDLVEGSLEPCRKVLKDAWLQASQVDEVILVWGSTRVPLVLKKLEEFFGKKPNASVNPDEAVALWAWIQAWIITWDVKDILLLDVTPLSLWIETLWGVMTRMIERNTTIPTSKSQVYSTAMDNQPSVEIHVLQWEREMAQDNKSLGRFILDGIASAPRWVPQIEVTFDIDASWVLHVTAKDKWTGKEQKIMIQWSTGMDNSEVDRLVKEAEANREADKKRKESIEARNMADSAIYQAEKTMKDNEWKFDSKLWDDAKEKIDALKKVLENQDASKEDIDPAMQTLQDAMMKIGQEIYSKAQAEWQQPAQEDDGVRVKDNNPKDDTVEGEVE